MRDSKPIHPNALAAVLKACADALRLEILFVLSQGSYGVLELAELFDVKQSGMSHHLKVLANAHLVNTRREGNSIFYRSALLSFDDDLFDLKNTLFNTVKHVQCNENQLQRLHRIHLQRSRISQQFFTENAHKFQQTSELIAQFPVYGPHIKEMLAKLPSRNNAQVLEVGPGAGELLPCLSQLFTSGLALDNSQAMLRQAQTLAEEENLDNITFVCADTSALQDYPAAFDCAVINMVLHHTPSPQHMLREVSHALQTGSSLLLSDLCLHTQEWVKQACGDLWMGFEPDELAGWAAQENLVLEQSSFIALRNGFQIQIQHFIKQ